MEISTSNNHTAGATKQLTGSSLSPCPSRSLLAFSSSVLLARFRALARRRAHSYDVNASALATPKYSPSPRKAAMARGVVVSLFPRARAVRVSNNHGSQSIK